LVRGREDLAATVASMKAQEPSPAFSEESTRPVLAEACARVGLDPAGASMLRLGENAIYRLDRAPVVVRIARSLGKLAEVRKEVRVARQGSGVFPECPNCPGVQE
jgi:hypothetical protein